MTAAYALVVALGLVTGSFLNVCIYRLPRKESMVWPGSRCGSCGRSLAWFENVPVLSWVLLGGRCRSCRAPISLMYPAVELVTALIFWAVLGGLTGFFWSRFARPAAA